MTQTNLPSLISEIVNELTLYNGFFNLNDPDDQPVLRPPASPRDIELLRGSRSHRLPPSYVALLSLHNGMDRFYMVNGSLYSTNFILENKGYEEEWERPSMFFVIGDEDWNAVAFDRNTEDADGEMIVQEYERNSEGARWPNLIAFLDAYLLRLHSWNMALKADKEMFDGR